MDACHHKIDFLTQTLNHINLHQNLNILMQSLSELSINYWSEKQMFKAEVQLFYYSRPKTNICYDFEGYSILQLWS